MVRFLAVSRKRSLRKMEEGLSPSDRLRTICQSTQRHCLREFLLANVVFQATYQGALTSVVNLFAFARSVDNLGTSEGAVSTALIPAVTLAMGACFLARQQR